MNKREARQASGAAPDEKPRLTRDHTGRLATKAITRRPRVKFLITLAPLVTLFTTPWVLWQASVSFEPLNLEKPDVMKERFLLQIVCFTLRVDQSPLSWHVLLKFLLLEVAFGRRMERVEETPLEVVK